MRARCAIRYAPGRGSTGESPGGTGRGAMTAVNAAIDRAQAGGCGATAIGRARELAVIPARPAGLKG